MWYTNWVWDWLSKKTTFKTKIGGGLGQGTSEKNRDPLHIFATIEASNFKFDTELWFGTSLPKKQCLRPKLAGVWARGTSQKNLGPQVECPSPALPFPIFPSLPLPLEVGPLNPARGSGERC